MSAAPPARRLLPFSGTVSAGPSTFTDVCKLGVCVCCHRDARGDAVAYEVHSGARDMPLRSAAARNRTMNMKNGAGAEYALRHRRRPRVSAPQHHHRPGSPFESWFVAFDTTFAEEATLRTRRCQEFVARFEPWHEHRAWNDGRGRSGPRGNRTPATDVRGRCPNR